MGVQYHRTARIVDDLTNLGLSRQRKYQIRNMRSRLCIECGGKAYRQTLFCETHNVKKGIKSAGRNKRGPRKWENTR